MKNLLKCLLLIAFIFSCRQGSNTNDGNVDTPTKDDNINIKRVLIDEKEAILNAGTYEYTVSKEAISSEIKGKITIELESLKSNCTVEEVDNAPLGNNTGDV